jgi:peroxiredoxin
VARNRRSGADAERAIALLIRDHAQDPRLGSACGGLIGSHPANEKLLRAILEKNPDRRVRGLACIALARKLDLESDNVRRLKENPELVERARASYSDDFLEWFLSRDPESMKAEARELSARAAAEFEITPIEIGKPAPEIEGKDARGEPFRLSDYRGKVVLLTFSGNWCPPCRAMYPVEREIIERFSGEPFTLLSVNTDLEKATLVDSIESGEITWRCWWDGPPGGSISTRWGVSIYPSLYVIDRNGIVRRDYGGVTEKDVLIEAIDALLDKPKQER